MSTVADLCKSCQEQADLIVDFLIKKSPISKTEKFIDRLKLQKQEVIFNCQKCQDVSLVGKIEEKIERAFAQWDAALQMKQKQRTGQVKEPIADPHVVTACRGCKTCLETVKEKFKLVPK